MSRAAEQLPSLAATGRLYPSIILHGGEPADRLALANEIARALLCEGQPETRPCGRCRHCRRIDIENDGVFHPDIVCARREPKKRETVIPVEKVRALLQTAQVSPFEARGQVFVIVEAEVLHPAGANVLLKTLEEPADRSPRNFLLLASSASELLPTLRSRSWTVYLGAGDVDDDDELASDLLDLWRRRPGDESFALWVSDLAACLVEDGGFEDIRARQGWTRIASAVAAAASGLDHRPDRAAALALAADLLDAHRLRQRSIQPRRIIEGLAVRRLRRDRPQIGFESSVNELLGPP